jgi:NAD(P)-dependent dehydrogenase (short-subunit alcohol dehydrogenase family)
MKSRDGHERRFAVNYLAHYALTRALLPLLVRSAPARIVNVSTSTLEQGVAAMLSVKGTSSASASPCAEISQLTAVSRASQVTPPAASTSTMDPAPEFGNSATPPHDPRPSRMLTSPR